MSNRIEQLIASDRPLTWVFTGDSITHGLVHTQGSRSFCEHFAEALRGELERVDDVVINTAVSGWRCFQLLDAWQQRVERWQPDVVVLMIGTNDASEGPERPFITPDDFAQQLDEALTRIETHGAVPVLMVPPPIDLARSPERSRFPEFVAAVRRVAQAHDLLTVDHHRAFAQLSEQPDCFEAPLMNDQLHPNALGHAFMAQTLLTELCLAERAPRTMGQIGALARLGQPYSDES